MKRYVIKNDLVICEFKEGVIYPNSEVVELAELGVLSSNNIYLYKYINGQAVKKSALELKEERNAGIRRERAKLYKMLVDDLDHEINSMILLEESEESINELKELKKNKITEIKSKLPLVQ
jgi:hypothetical protein